MAYIRDTESEPHRSLTFLSAYAWALPDRDRTRAQHRRRRREEGTGPSDQTGNGPRAGAGLLLPDDRDDRKPGANSRWS